MKILHILRSKPDKNCKQLIEKMSNHEESEEFHLFNDEIDYDLLLRKIFDFDKVISWW